MMSFYTELMAGIIRWTPVNCRKRGSSLLHPVSKERRRIFSEEKRILPALSLLQKPVEWSFSSNRQICLKQTQKSGLVSVSVTHLWHEKKRIKMGKGFYMDCVVRKGILPETSACGGRWRRSVVGLLPAVEGKVDFPENTFPQSLLEAEACVEFGSMFFSTRSMISLALSAGKSLKTSTFPP